MTNFVICGDVILPTKEELEQVKGNVYVFDTNLVFEDTDKLKLYCFLDSIQAVKDATDSDGTFTVERVKENTFRLSKKGIKMSLPDNNIVYIYYSKVPLNCYEVQCIVEDFSCENRAFIQSDKKLSLTELMEKKLTGVFPVFSGKGTPNPDTETLKVIKSMLTIVYWYYYYQINNRKMIAPKRSSTKEKLTMPNWCMNPETVAIKGCIHTYKLFPRVKDRTILMEMIESANYRYAVFETLRRVSANFCINSGIVTDKNWNFETVNLALRKVKSMCSKDV
ncbi:MAG: hypothetical protein KatS3mg101_0901 [Patescibacteria group bacterium]|nr:MAG: hypothetical protein KatS3mg101_0901 [Patescibacteria group bacterium]